MTFQSPRLTNFDMWYRYGVFTPPQQNRRSSLTDGVYRIGLEVGIVPLVIGPVTPPLQGPRPGGIWD